MSSGACSAHSGSDEQRVALANEAFEDPPQLVWCSEADEAAEGALAVAGSRVEQDARLVTPRVGVDALADARRRVPALQGDLPDEQVRQRVQQQVPVARPVVLVRSWEVPVLAPPAVRST